MTEKEWEREEMSKSPDDLQKAFEEGWEISEDDFEETQDLTETAAQLSGMEGPQEDEEADIYEEEEENPEADRCRNAARNESVGRSYGRHGRQDDD